jgi:preprotein translocase subunit SecF
VQADSQEPDAQARVTEAMAELGGNVPLEQVSVNDVGPSWGDEVTKKARNALVVFFVLITAYISLRFEWKMAMAAIAAVVHDIFVTVGVYSLSRFEVTPATVVAFLTILGYSLYDTIVVFDKVEENAKGLAAQRRMTYSDTVNLSMNQVLMRSLNTSLVAILPILSVLLVGAGLLGATTLKDFGLALLIGLITGAYSSIYIASPILAMLKEREPQYAGIRHRVEARGGSAVLTPAAAAAAAGGDKVPARSPRRAARAAPEDDEELIAAPPKSPPPRPRANQPSKPRSGGGGGNRPPPRPRKKGKRR